MIDVSKYDIDYSKLIEACGSLERRFGRQGKLQLKNEDYSVLRSDRLLDVGSGEGNYASLCNQYYRFEQDMNRKAEFRTIDEVKKSGITFDAAVCNQVLEHMPFDEVLRTVELLKSVLEQGSKCLITLPNIHRGNYFYSNIGHITPLTYYHIGALLELNDFEVIDAYRYTKRLNELLSENETVQQIFSLLEKYYELDPAFFIAVVAQRK